MALNWFKSSGGSTDRAAEPEDRASVAPSDRTSAKATASGAAPADPSAKDGADARSTSEIRAETGASTAHPNAGARRTVRPASDPFDPLALEERLREARARRAEALARRKVGDATEKPDAPDPASAPLRPARDAAAQVVPFRTQPATPGATLGATPSSITDTASEPPVAGPVVTPAPLVAPERPAFMQPHSARRTGRWILPLLFLSGIAIGGAGMLVAPDDLRERVSAVVGTFAPGSEVRDVSVIAPEPDPQPVADPAPAPTPDAEPTAATPPPAPPPPAATAPDADTAPTVTAPAGALDPTPPAGTEPVPPAIPPTVTLVSAPDPTPRPDATEASPAATPLAFDWQGPQDGAAPTAPAALPREAAAFRTSLAATPPAPPPVPAASPDPAADAVPVTDAPAVTGLPLPAAAMEGRRVFLHVPASVSQRTVSDALAALREAGFSDVSAVPVGLSIGKTNVRYYHAGDGSAAHRIAAVLNASLDIDPPQPRDFTHFKPTPLPGTLEVWLSGQTNGRVRAQATSRAGAGGVTPGNRAADEIQALVEQAQPRRQTIVRTRRVPDEPAHPLGRLGREVDRAVGRFATGERE